MKFLMTAFILALLVVPVRADESKEPKYNHDDPNLIQNRDSSVTVASPAAPNASVGGTENPCCEGNSSGVTIGASTNPSSGRGANGSTEKTTNTQ